MSFVQMTVFGNFASLLRMDEAVAPSDFFHFNDVAFSLKCQRIKQH